MTDGGGGRAERSPLTVAATGTLIAVGVGLWLIAALLLRWIVPLGAFEGFLALVTYALVIPGTIPFVLAIRSGLGLGGDRLPLAVAVVTASALLVDGVVVRWFPGVYGSTAADVATAAGAVLWGAGVGLVLGFAMRRG